MSELIIHIGSHKTGTTSIQEACRHHPMTANDRAAKYIDIRLPNNKIISSKGKLENFRTTIDINLADSVFQPERLTAKSDRTKFITSSEEFFWIHEPESVNKFADLLRNRFNSIKVVCYLRRQDLLATSHRKQAAKKKRPAARFYGISATPLPRYKKYFNRYFDYATKLRDIWASSFGRENIILTPFDRQELVEGDVVKDFAYRTGIQFSLANPIRRNEAIGKEQLLLGAKLTEANFPLEMQQEILKKLPEEGRPLLPSRSEAMDFLAHFEAANERLAQEWSWRGQPFRFSDSFEMYPESEQQWSTEEVSRLLGAVLESVEKPGMNSKD